jgi:hypothetical protein
LDLKNAVGRIEIPEGLFPVQLALLSYPKIDWDRHPFEVSDDGKRFLVNLPDQLQAAEPINVG